MFFYVSQGLFLFLLTMQNYDDFLFREHKKLQLCAKTTLFLT